VSGYKVARGPGGGGPPRFPRRLLHRSDARFAKPLDHDLIRRLTRSHRMLVTVEDGAVGGFGSHVLDHVVNNGLAHAGLALRTLTLPDRFQDHDDPQRQYDEAGLNAASIAQVIESSLRRSA
jgi:1-deoxy-D-xylulose-5-phosphate synthase